MIFLDFYKNQIFLLKSIDDFLERYPYFKNKIIQNIDEINKLSKINLIVINLEKASQIDLELEEYLIKTNKKILLISENKPKFKTNFIYRQEVLESNFFTYFKYRV